MSKFIELTKADGSKVCVNMDLVQAFTSDTNEYDECKTVLSTGTGNLWVKESYEDIISLLQDGTRVIQ